MELKNYKEIISTINPEFSEEINSSKKFKQICNDIILSSTNLESIPSWCKIIGYNKKMFTDVTSDSYAWFFENHTLVSSDIDMLKNILDLGYNESFNETNLIVELTLDYDYSSLNEGQYQPLIQIIHSCVRVNLDTEFTIDLINSIYPSLIVSAIENRRVFENIDTHFEEFLYENRKELSDDLIEELLKRFYSTPTRTTKLFLALVLEMNEPINLSDYSIPPYGDSFVYIKGTFEKMQNILDSRSLRLYYSKLSDVALIENISHLEYLFQFETMGFNGKMFMYLRENLNLNDDVLGLLFIDEKVTINVFTSMMKHIPIRTYYNPNNHLGDKVIMLDIYNLILIKQPTWNDFRAKCMQEPIDLV